MPASAITIPDLAKLNFFNATTILSANTANFRLALITSVYTPNNTTDELFSAVSANEIAAGFGYTAGGGVLTGVALTQSAGTVRFTSNAFTWTAAGGSIPAWRRGVIYYLGTLNGKVNPLVGHFLGDNTPADIPATASGNSLTITPSGSGLISAT